MEIDELMRRFALLGDSLIGQGPEHPESPNPSLRNEVESFIEDFPFLKRDKGFLDYLYRYAGAFVEKPEELFVSIYGFYDNISLHFRDEAFGGPIVSPDGLLTFCNMVLERGTYQNNDEPIFPSFSFDATGQRRWGVYRTLSNGRVGETRNEWYCYSFLDWLTLLVEKEGRLADAPFDPF